MVQIVLEAMPFFLVTYTTLVEADNEVAAARDAVDAVRSGSEIRVTVKSDEETTRVVAVSAMQSAAAPSSPPEDTTTDVASPAVSARAYPPVGEPVPGMPACKTGYSLTAQHFVVLCITAAAAIWFLI
ncbi:hypothetical protein HRR99_15190 [Agrobacterium vaccinii]|uniref:hypothetical protein n=1 Tax=Agrobacterium vaccinii TaxID=2735528 RepID=UPI001E431E28|nr:hypothetical protein [Agrobacterium vaccinii]UHS62971.1 hypothetical protein HRR99_15190 [Agrobacterium vaccinii]